MHQVVMAMQFGDPDEDELKWESLSLHPQAQPEESGEIIRPATVRAG